VARAAGRLEGMAQPLPLAPPGSTWIADGIALFEDTTGSGAVFVWGQATWCWDASDPGARRLAAVQIVNADAGRQRDTAAAFGVNETTLWRWREDYEAGGTAALLPKPMGPKRPSKLTADKVAEIKALRESGLSLEKVAAATGVSPNSVKRAAGAAPPAAPAVGPGGGLVPLALPADRSAERQAARAGLLAEAAPAVTEGASLPFAGALVILPALAATGLLEVAAAVYGAGRHVAGARRAAFYGLRSLVLCVVMSLLLGEPRAEGLTRTDPVAIGRLIGLDRAPEVKRLRARLAELAGEGRSGDLLSGLAAHHVAARPEAVGLLYVDGHVRAYHGKADVGKAHLARMRIAMPAELDTWVSDRFGDGLLVWQAPPGASLSGELSQVARQVRALVGEGARPTVCFDRGGWSPSLFRRLVEEGFDVLTYRKGKAPREPRSAFAEHTFTDDRGKEHTYLLADRAVRIAYSSGKRYFACRQVTRLDEVTGHQTQVLTTRGDEDAALVAHAMFSRWRQENFFKYMRAHYGIDALDAYETVPDDAARLVANPARRDADRSVREARAAIALAEEAEGRASVAGQAPTAEIGAAFAAARDELSRREATARSLPAKVPLARVRPAAVRLATERKRIMDAVRMATYNAESSLARLVAPHYARADDEARSLLREAFRTSADIEVVGTTVHVRLDPLSAPRRAKAVAGLCEELTASETLYPGTDLTLVYSVKER
jgi:transposase-like protein